MEVHLILPDLPSRERSASVRRDLLNKAVTRAPERSNCIFNQPVSIFALLNISSYGIARLSLAILCASFLDIHYLFKKKQLICLTRQWLERQEDQSAFSIGLKIYWPFPIFPHLELFVDPCNTLTNIFKHSQKQDLLNKAVTRGKIKLHFQLACNYKFSFIRGIKNQHCLLRVKGKYSDWLWMGREVKIDWL